MYIRYISWGQKLVLSTEGHDQKTSQRWASLLTMIKRWASLLIMIKRWASLLTMIKRWTSLLTMIKRWASLLTMIKGKQVAFFVKRHHLLNK